MAKLCKPYVYDAIDCVLYIDLVFWERLTMVTKTKIVELSEGKISPSLGGRGGEISPSLGGRGRKISPDLDEPFSIVIRETLFPVISNINRVCGSLYANN